MLVVGVALVNTPSGQALGTQQLTGPRGFADMAWRLCCSLVQGLCISLYTCLNCGATGRMLDLKLSHRWCL